MNHVVARWDGSEQELRDVAELYAAVFAESPYEDDEPASRADLIGHVAASDQRVPGFRLLLARSEQRIIGMAMSRAIAPGDAWWDTAASQLPDAEVRRWFDGGCLCLNELAVSRGHRRQGVAAALMAATLARVEHETAVLACDPRATAARGFYARHGWTGVGPVRFDGQPYEVLATVLP